MADTVKVVDAKIMADGQIMAGWKSRRMVKSSRQLKIRWMVKSLRPLKIRRMIKSLHPSKSLHLVKYQCPWKCRKSRLPVDKHILLLVDVMNLVNVVSKGGMVPQCPVFMGGLSPVLYRMPVPAHHAQKWSKSTWQPKIRRLPGIPLISVSHSSL